ncbi:MAG: hydroxyacid dehydrogenase [Chitinophagia bacterium]|nr:hydroxyacid dehydrogenase [Chitinophagia bacterium]
MAPVVLITAPTHPCLQEGLQQAGYTIEVHERPNRAWLLEQISRFTGMVISTHPQLDAALLEQAKQLQWIARLGSGMEHIDTVYAEKKGIRCISSPEGNCGSVGEHVLAMVLSLLRNIPISSGEVKQGIWIREMQRHEELSGKTIGIIGYGHTGAAFARLLEPFGVKVLAHDKYKSGFSNQYVRESTIEAVKEQADIISLHLPLTEETRWYADINFFEALQRQPLFINAARGGLVDTDALCMALERNKIGGAALDVLENEQLTTYSGKEREQLQYLLGHNRVLITPHIAGYSKQAFRKMSEVILQKLGMG